MDAILLLIMIASLGYFVYAAVRSLTQIAKGSREQAPPHAKRAGIAFVICIIALFAIPAVQDDTSTQPIEESTAEKNQPSQDKDEENDTNKETESEPLTVEETIKEEIDNNEVTNFTESSDKSIVSVTVDRDTVLTLGTGKSSMLQDYTDLMKVVYENFEEVRELDVTYTLKATDDYGNESDMDAIIISTTRSTHEKINYENFYYEDLPNIADHYWQHQQFD